MRYTVIQEKKRLPEGTAMLFQKSIEPRCAYCTRSAPLDDDSLLCAKKGVVSPGGHCRAFQYDPFKRVPPRPVAPDFSKLKDEDFTL